MNQSNTFHRIQQLLQEKDKYTKSLKNLDLLKEKGEITFRQYEELKSDYTRKLEDLDEALASLKKELKEEVQRLRREKEGLEEQVRKIEIRALIGEIPEEKAKNQIARTQRKIDSLEKKLHLYEAAVVSSSYGEFQARLERKIHRKDDKQFRRLKSFRQLLVEKEKQDNSIKKLEELYKQGEVNKKEYENLKREYLFKLEEIIDQIESIRREIELYIAEIKVEKEHLENDIEEVEVRIKVGEITEKEGKETIESHIKQIKTLDQHIFKLMKIMRANSPSQLEGIIEEEKEKVSEEEEKEKIAPTYPPRKKKFRVSYVSFAILIILIAGYFMKDKILPVVSPDKTSGASTQPVYNSYPMYLYNPSHTFESPNSNIAKGYNINLVKSIGERLMLPEPIGTYLFLVGETGRLYRATLSLDSTNLVDSLPSFIDNDPLNIGPYTIISDLDGNIYVFNSSDLTLKKRLKVEGSITAQPASTDGIIYIFTEAGNLYSYDVVRDSVLWNLKLEQGGRATPIISGKYLYVLDMAGTLYKFDRTRGTRIGDIQLNEPCVASPIAYKGNIFLGTLKGSLYAIQMDSMKIVYKIDTHAPLKSSPAAAKGAVIVGDFNGTCYAFSTLDTTLLWMYNTGAPNILGISIYDSVVVVANTEKLIALNLYTTGNIAELLWERKIQSGVISKPPFLYKDNIYLVTVDGKIILLSPPKAS